MTEVIKKTSAIPSCVKISDDVHGKLPNLALGLILNLQAAFCDILVLLYLVETAIFCQE